METESPLLTLSDISKTYPGTSEPVLNGVSASVTRGESIAIVGPSGCGKSTLLNIIGTLDSPSSGEIVFDGRDPQKFSDAERAAFRNESIGFVFQSHHLLPQCSAIENVLIPTLVRKDGAPSRERAMSLLDRVGLSDRVDYRPGKLSGGERQRVAVVRALINEPALLLADEPTGSLSREGAEDLGRLLLELNREEGLTLIVVTHSDALARSMGRVLRLEDGTLAEDSAQGE